MSKHEVVPTTPTMTMKIGFSTVVCPDWDLATILDRGAECGFDSVEIRGLRGELQLPLAPDLAARPDRTRAMFAEKNLKLACLGMSATLDARHRRAAAEGKAEVLEYIELARRLGCPFVRLFAGEVQPRGDNYHKALSRIAAALSKLIPVATRAGVTVLVENGGDFPGSEALWFLVDSVGHPAVRCCWNPATALTIGERASNSIPRLAQKLGLVHLTDAEYDEEGVLLNYVPLGQGAVGIARIIELLKGLVYDGHVIFDWPRLWFPSLAPPDAVLPDAAKFLRACLDDRQAVLTAYKGDKQAPRLSGTKMPNTLARS